MAIHGRSDALLDMRRFSSVENTYDTLLLKAKAAPDVDASAVLFRSRTPR